MAKAEKLPIYVFVCVLLIALSLRILDFPPRYQLRDVDELGYTYGGLLLWEGLPPGFKMSPAGIQTWISWAYCAGKSMANLARYRNKEDLSALLRPFFAIDATLFEIYRDISTLRRLTVWIIILISLGAVWAAFQMGFRRAGIFGGILSGGLTALLPIFVQASGMAKPYLPAWSFAIIAHCFAALPANTSRLTASAIFMGLAISSRIEMLLFFPVILWEIWNENGRKPFARFSLRLVLITVITTLLISPWLVTGLLGNIRTIATVRLSGAPAEDLLVPLFKDFLWFQGLGPVALLLVAGLAVGSSEKRRKKWLLLSIFLVLFLTMLRPTPYGLRHHGATVVAAIVISPLALSQIRRLHSKMGSMLAAALLVLPAINSIVVVESDRRSCVPDKATAWVEQNVPSGTRVYLCPTLHDPLPTRQSGDALWAEVTSVQAWETKFQHSLARFDLLSDWTPRALSEENMVQERGNRRRWFILGADMQKEMPRYDIKIISGGSPFDITPANAIAEFVRTGGAFILRQSRQKEFQPPPEILGVPKASWTSPEGEVVSVYFKPAATGN